MPFLVPTLFYIQVIKIECKWQRRISEDHPSQERLTYHFKMISKLFKTRCNNNYNIFNNSIFTHEPLSAIIHKDINKNT